MTTLAANDRDGVAAFAAGVQRHLVERAPFVVHRSSDEHRESLWVSKAWDECFGCFAQELGPRGEVEHALQVELAKRSVARGPLHIDKGRMLLGIQPRTPINGVLRTQKGRDAKLLDASQEREIGL